MPVKPETQTSQLTSEHIDGKKQSIFNVAYLANPDGIAGWDSADSDGIAVARYYQNTKQDEQCGVKNDMPQEQRGTNLAVAKHFPNQEMKFTNLEIPKEVACKYVGEPKLFRIRGEVYLYGHSHVDCPKQNWEKLTGSWKQTYADSVYKNYLYKLDFENMKLTDGVLLSTESPINPVDKTQKNFQIFAHGNETYAITMVSPEHKVYKVDLSTGAMTPAYSSKGLSVDSEADQKMYFGFARDKAKAKKDRHMYLSGAPLDLGDGTLLVAAHVAAGSWGGLRQSFFYKIKSEPPFNIVASTPSFSFGFDEKLEYLTGINQVGDEFIISVGVKDCDSEVFRIPKKQILSKMQAFA